MLTPPAPARQNFQTGTKIRQINHNLRLRLLLNIINSLLRHRAATPASSLPSQRLENSKNLAPLRIRKQRGRNHFSQRVYSTPNPRPRRPARRGVGIRPTYSP